MLAALKVRFTKALRKCKISCLDFSMYSATISRSASKPFFGPGFSWYANRIILALAVWPKICRNIPSRRAPRASCAVLSWWLGIASRQLAEKRISWANSWLIRPTQLTRFSTNDSMPKISSKRVRHFDESTEGMAGSHRSDLANASSPTEAPTVSEPAWFMTRAWLLSTPGMRTAGLVAVGALDKSPKPSPPPRGEENGLDKLSIFLESVACEVGSTGVLLPAFCAALCKEFNWTCWLWNALLAARRADCCPFICSTTVSRFFPIFTKFAWSSWTCFSSARVLASGCMDPRDGTGNDLWRSETIIGRPLSILWRDLPRSSSSRDRSLPEAMAAHRKNWL